MSENLREISAYMRDSESFQLQLLTANEMKGKLNEDMNQISVTLAASEQEKMMKNELLVK